MSTFEKFEVMLQPWVNAQRPMSKIVRWGNFPEYGQTLTEHMSSIPYVLTYVEDMLNYRGDIDWLLLHRCVIVHDQGEPLSGGDEHADNKTENKEYLEYNAVARMMNHDTPFARSFMRAFLLQYVRKLQFWEQFDGKHQLMLEVLSKTKAKEAAIFEMVERLDYLASAVIGYRSGIRNDKETMIDHVLKRQIPKLDGLLVEFPELSWVWSTSLRSSLLMLGSEM
jgi:hypothetical protein